MIAVAPSGKSAVKQCGDANFYPKVFRTSIDLVFEYKIAFLEMLITSLNLLDFLLLLYILDAGYRHGEN